MATELRFEQGVFSLRTPDGAETRIASQAGDLDAFRDWAERYERAARIGDDAALLAIGLAMRGWLDGRGLERMLDEGASGGRDIRFAAPTRPDADQQAFLDVPWEVMADGAGFWAQDAIVPYRPARLLGRAGPAAPRHADLFVLFMAAAPLGEKELDYEAEEAGMRDATRGLEVEVVVEESGELEQLSRALARGLPFETLHLSCHGGIVDGKGVLALESAHGDRDLADAARLVPALGEAKPALVFLSACQSAELGGGSTPLALDLVRGGVPNLLGWDGSVYDSDAIAFARAFYGELAKRRAVPGAAASARRALLDLRGQGNGGGRHWHMARVYLGPQGAGPLLDAAKAHRPRVGLGGYQAFLDKKSRVKVASPEVFVARRRETQRILRHLASQPSHAGVLIHGMGRLGKSSLAARVSQRMPAHRIAVVFGEQPGEYGAAAVLDAVVEALPATLREEARQTWSEAVRRDPRRLKDALEAILTGPAARHDPASGCEPILLVIDDLERILETPVAGQQRVPVQRALRDTLRAVVKAFDAARGRSASRLILTSRYVFTLPDEGGSNLADRLLAIQPPPMDARQQGKLLDAEARVASATPGAAEDALLNRAARASGGNPGLLALLSRPARNPATAQAAEAAIAAVEAYRRGEGQPIEGDLGAFFTQMTLDTYRQALTPDETAQMRAALIFQPFPVPPAVMEAAGGALTVPDPATAIARLLALGCMDAYHAAGEAKRNAPPDLAVNVLAAPLFGPLSDAETARVASHATPPLYRAWCDKGGDLPWDERAVLMVDLTRSADADANIVNAAATAAAFHFRNRQDDRAVLALVEDALPHILGRQAQPGLHLVRLGAESAGRLGETGKARDLMAQGLAVARSGSEADERAVAAFWGSQADALRTAGEVDEALRILREEVEPAFERLGDVRERAVTMGQIADVLAARGEVEEALRIHLEERLPVYERLGDVRSRAVTMGRIADVLAARGEMDEALRIRREEQLPVYEHLGDVRERAVTMVKVADVLAARGEADEALRIHLEERLPVAVRLGDVDSVAHIRYRCAEIRLKRGVGDEETLKTILEELGEAFAILRGLQQAEGIAFVGLRFGGLELQLGQTEAAIAILGESAAAFRKLGHEENAAAIEAKIAAARG